MGISFDHSRYCNRSDRVIVVIVAVFTVNVSVTLPKSGK